MSEPDDPNTQLVVVNQLLGSVAGEAQAELSGWLGDHFRTRRLRSIARTLEKTHRILEEVGLDAHKVPLKTLSPLLEGASYEEESDKSMTDRWAALLARAASGGAEIPPGYVRTLADLTPRQAELLDRFYVDGQRPCDDGRDHTESGRAGPNLADLERLGLIRWDNTYEMEHWEITTFGRHFVELCKPEVG